MPEVRDLEAKLAALRREVADTGRAGFTPRNCVSSRILP
jgi:hypothetical protein